LNLGCSSAVFHLSCLTSYDTQIALKNMIINDYTLDAEMIEFCKSAIGNMPDEDLVSGARKLPELLKGRALQLVHDVRDGPFIFGRGKSGKFSAWNYARRFSSALGV
jgi:hypothetical protein